MGRVILGMPGQWAESNLEISDHRTSKIGGVPDWPSDDFEFKPELLSCKLCRATLCLVTQVYAPVYVGGSNIEERVIYIFACIMPECARNHQSWRTIRVQKWENTIQSNDDCYLKKTQVGALENSVSSTCDSLEEHVCEMDSVELNEDSDCDMNLEQLGQALLEASSKKQNDSEKSKRGRRKVKTIPMLADTIIPAIPCFYIYSQEEPLKFSKDTVIASLSSFSIIENQRSMDDDGDGEKWEPEQYEYDNALTADRSYLKFKKRMDLCPEQCFRYSFNGNPLLPENSIEQPGVCGICGAMRHYEMQLMPPLLYFLQEASNGDALIKSLKEWDWMTVIIYTCSKSCFQESVGKGDFSLDSWTVSEESTIIQYEV